MPYFLIFVWFFVVWLIATVVSWWFHLSEEHKAIVKFIFYYVPCFFISIWWLKWNWEILLNYFSSH